MSKLKITLLHSAIRRPHEQKATLHALGLRKLHHSVIQPDNPSIRGMIFRVKHLVEVQEIEEGGSDETA